MYKKSIIIVIVQLFGAILGLLTIYLVAGDMEPEVYSLTGIYTIMSTVVITFSDLGIETTMAREALYWKEKKDESSIIEYASQALFSRLIAFLILIPAMTAYALIINITKYDGKHLVLLLVFVVAALLNALINSMALIVRSLGGYVFSQIASTANSYLIKFLGIGIYLWKGAYAYLFFYGMASVPLAIIYLIKLRGLLDFRKMKFKGTFKKIVSGRYLWLKTDLDYFKNNADSMLVSAFFPAGILGSYSIYKQLEQLAKTVIEGFFDVLSQHTVKYKGNEQELLNQEHKIKKARNIIMSLVLVAGVIFIFIRENAIRLIHLNNYQYIDWMICCVVLVSIFHLIGKYEINALAFFGTSKMNFNIGVTIFVVSCLSYFIVLFIPTIAGVLIQRIIIYAVTSFLSIYLFRKNKTELYTKILK